MSKPFEKLIVIDLTSLFISGFLLFVNQTTVQDLEEAIKQLSLAVYIRSIMPVAQDSCRAARYEWFTTLGRAFTQHYAYTLSVSDARQACEQFQAAYLICPLDSPDRPQLLAMYGASHSSIADHTLEPAHLKAAVDLLRRSLTEPNLLEDVPWHTYRLAHCLLWRYNCGHREDPQIRRGYLDEAIATYRIALDLSPPDHDLTPIYGGLVDALAKRWEWSRSLSNLDEAIRLLRTPSTYTPDSRMHSLSELGGLLVERFRHTHNREELNEAIHILRQCLDADQHPQPVPPPPKGALRRVVAVHSERALLQAAAMRRGTIQNLLQAYNAQYELLGDPADLGHVTGIIQKNLQISSEDDILQTNFTFAKSVHWADVQCYVSIFTLKYNFSQELPDLDKVILWTGKLVELCPQTEIQHATHLATLGFCLFRRHTRTHTMVDLKESIHILRQAAELLPPEGDRSRGDCLHHLAVALSSSYDLSSRIDELNEAIELHTKAAQILLGPDDKATVQHNLALDLFRRVTAHDGTPERTEDTSGSKDVLEQDLDNAIAMMNKVLKTNGQKWREHSQVWDKLLNKATMHRHRYKLYRNISDLQDTISLLEEAFRIAPSDHTSFSALARGLADAYLLEEPCRDLDQPFTLFEKAVTSPMSPARDRLDVAVHWIREATRHNHHSVVGAHYHWLSLIEHCLMLYPTVESQHQFIVQLPANIASSACCAAIGARQLEKAVELLEQCRGLLWGKAMRLRHPLDALRQVNIDLSNKLEASSKELESLAVADRPTGSILLNAEVIGQTASGISPHRFAYQMQMQRLHTASLRWQQTMDHIRQLDGFANFLRATPFSELQKAATEGPIIVVNVSGARTDAIIVRDTYPPVLVPLRNAKMEDIEELAETMALTLDIVHEDAGSWVTKSATEASPADGEDVDKACRFMLQKANKDTKKVLRRLWTLIVEPVARMLDKLGIEPQSRVWWCPTSDFWKLPLHAAGPYVKGELNFPDLYISSYISSFSRILKSRAICTDSVATPPSMLVVGVPGEPDEDTFLGNVEDEIDKIVNLWPSEAASSLRLLVNKDAVLESVQRDLPECSWIHITCHGFQDPEDPYNSFFQLYKDRIKLKDIMRSDLPKAELAFLSACDSAKGDMMADEVIHLAAAMQFCGFHSVVGTMWPMADEDGPHIAETFYKYMLNPPDGKPVSFRNSAAALHFAVKHLREKKVPLYRWVNFVHYGL